MHAMGILVDTTLRNPSDFIIDFQFRYVFSDSLSTDRKIQTLNLYCSAAITALQSVKLEFSDKINQDP